MNEYSAREWRPVEQDNGAGYERAKSCCEGAKKPNGNDCVGGERKGSGVEGGDSKLRHKRCEVNKEGRADLGTAAR